MKMFMEAIDSWMSIEACNWNREGELDCHREDEESQTAREATYNDVEQVVND
jgi:hypothetical protein